MNNKDMPALKRSLAERLELQIAWRLEEQLCDGRIDADLFVVDNRKALRELIDAAMDEVFTEVALAELNKQPGGEV